MICYLCKEDKKKCHILRSKKQRARYMCSDCNKKSCRKYHKTEAGRKSLNAASKRSYIKHKEKWVARAKARYAVKKGIIKKPKRCEVCNLVKPLQGHHEDYSKPLQVIWLCWSCHADADRPLTGHTLENKNL